MAELDPTQGHEQSGRRPVVVLSQDVFNERSGTVIACAQPKLLIIDEVGYLGLDQAGAAMLFQIICHRYEKNAATIINIKGESYRLKDKRKAGLFPSLHHKPEKTTKP